MLPPAEQIRVLSRRSKVAALLLKGTRPFEIVTLLGMETTQRPIISRDIKWIKRQWRATAIRPWDLMMGREIAKLDLLEETAWKALEKSMQPLKSKRTRTAMREGKSNTVEDSEEEHVQERLADPRYMDVIWKCINKRCEICGLNAAQKHEVTVTKGGELPPNDKAIVERFEAMVSEQANLLEHRNGDAG